MLREVSLMAVNDCVAHMALGRHRDPVCCHAGMLGSGAVTPWETFQIGARMEIGQSIGGRRGMEAAGTCAVNSRLPCRSRRPSTDARRRLRTDAPVTRAAAESGGELGAADKPAWAWKEADTRGSNAGCIPQARQDSRYLGRVVSHQYDTSNSNSRGATNDDNGKFSAASQWWDAYTFSAGPTLLLSPAEAPNGASWIMAYFGRDREEWALGIRPPLDPIKFPMGRVGMATSADGVSWQRVTGPLPGGAVLDPSSDEDAFDCVHVGVGDLVRDPMSGEWLLYYFGAGRDALDLPQFGLVGLVGLRFRPGLATSSDGLHFAREAGGAPLLDFGGPGAWDELSLGWPCVLPPSATGATAVINGSLPACEQPVADDVPLVEHGTYAVGTAWSSDGRQWRKGERVLGPGPPGSWDDLGPHTRQVLRVSSDELVMFYCGQSARGEYGIGIATSRDGGATWAKDEGGPVFGPRRGTAAWDSETVESPWVVATADGSFRMYYYGEGTVGGRFQQGIGLAVSAGPDFRQWRRHEPVASA
eukprot:SM000064S19802  [mRNA]  locus=s64:517711:519766:- [translate_table: standard]